MSNISNVKYLSYEGLEHLVSKLKDYIGNEVVITKGDGQNSIISKNGVSKYAILGHYQLSGPTYFESSLPDRIYTYSLANGIDGELSEFLEIIIGSEEQIYSNDLRLIEYDSTAGTVSFNLPIDYSYDNTRYTPNNISNKYFPLGYIVNVEENILSTATNDGSVAFGRSVSKGISSFSNNKAHAYAHYSYAEGNGGYNAKIGRHFQGEQVNPGTNEEDGYAGAYGIGSHVEGNLSVTTQAGSYGHAEGHSTVVNAYAGHAEGRQTLAAGMGSHAEGNSPIAFGSGSHAEGFGSLEYGSVYYKRIEKPSDLIGLWANGYKDPETGNTTLGANQFLLAYGDSSHAEGINTLAEGKASHAGGNKTHAKGDYSVSLGNSTKAKGMGSISSGYQTLAETVYSFAGGKNSKTIVNAGSSFAFGDGAIAEGYQTVAVNKGTHAKGNYSAAFGLETKTTNTAEFAIGKYNVSSTNTLFTIGDGTKDIAKNALSVQRDGSNIVMLIGENRAATVKDLDAYAKTEDLDAYTKTEDLPIQKTNENGFISISIGNPNKAINANAFAIGNNTAASGVGSFTMGYKTIAESAYAFAGGKNSQILGETAGSSFAFGEGNVVQGYQSTALGRGVKVNKSRSFAAGDYLTTNNNYEAAFGKYNKSATGSTLFSVGNGTSDTNRANVFEITNDGKFYINTRQITEMTNSDIEEILNKYNK